MELFVHYSIYIHIHKPDAYADTQVVVGDTLTDASVGVACSLGMHLSTVEDRRCHWYNGAASRQQCIEIIHVSYECDVERLVSKTTLHLVELNPSIIAACWITTCGVERVLETS